MNGLDMMRARLQVRGGVAQQDRMIKDKRKSLDRAILYSYQGARIRKIESEEYVPALINPNAVKQDYDDKIVSVGYEYGYKPGTVFEWINNTKWLIYLQDLTELAYFKGDIRKCSYEVKWKDVNGDIKSTYVALIGPSQKSITSITKEGFNMDLPNYTLSILMPKNEDTLAYFTRYAEFYLQGLEKPICWRVEATDSITMPGILEVHAVEYYANKTEDDLESGIVGGLLVEPIAPEPTAAEIKGESFIKPKISYTYDYIGNEEGEWSWDSKLPIEAKVNGKQIIIKWTTTYTGEFVLSFGSSKKAIAVESLF